MSLFPQKSPVELIVDEAHFQRVVLRGMLRAKTSLDITTADLKAMLIPPVPGSPPGSSPGGGGRRRGWGRADSIITHLVRLADRGVEIRLLHAGVPSAAARAALKRTLPVNLIIRRCPRLHAKSVIVDAQAMYLGSANMTGAGLGAKSSSRRNIEWGIWTDDAHLIDGVLEQFNQLWEGHRCEDCGRKDICPSPLEEPQLLG